MKRSKLIAGVSIAALAALAAAAAANAQVYSGISTSAAASGTTLPAPGYAPTTTGIPDFLASPNLTVGSRGGYVTDLQSELAELGYMAPPPMYGYFGPLTRAAVEAYQRALSLPITGYFGTLTKTGLSGLMTSLSAKIAQSSGSTVGIPSVTGISVTGTVAGQGPSSQGMSTSVYAQTPLHPTGYWYNGNWYASIPAPGTAGVTGYWLNGVWTPLPSSGQTVSQSSTAATSTAAASGTFGISTSRWNPYSGGVAAACASGVLINGVCKQ